jgi:hypothetical protein
MSSAGNNAPPLNDEAVVPPQPHVDVDNKKYFLKIN